jgi:hypothetical protein
MAGAAVTAVLAVASMGVLVARLTEHHGTTVRVAASPSAANSTSPISAQLLWIEGDVAGTEPQPAQGGGPRLADPNTGNTTSIGPSGLAGTWCGTCPFVRIGNRAFTAQDDRVYMYVPGKTTLTALGPGSRVLPTADNKSLLIVIGDQLEQESSQGHLTGGPWTIPHGYELTSPARATVDGVLVEKTTTAATHQLADWNPPTGQIRQIGSFARLIDTYTSAGASSSTLALTSCPSTGRCSLELTDSRTGATTRISPPSVGTLSGDTGFDGGGAFSPDGSQLAAFISETSVLGPEAKVAIIDMHTLAVEVVKGSDVGLGESYGYASWSPSGEWLFFGGLSGPVDGVRRGDVQARVLPVAGGYSLVALERPPGLGEPTTVPLVAVPNVLGLSLTNARGALASLGLRISIAPNAYATSPTVKVVAQEPPGEALLRRGSQVQVHLGSQS